MAKLESSLEYTGPRVCSTWLTTSRSTTARRTTRECDQYISQLKKYCDKRANGLRQSRNWVNRGNKRERDGNGRVTRESSCEGVQVRPLLPGQTVGCGLKIKVVIFGKLVNLEDPLFYSLVPLFFCQPLSTFAD